MEFVKCRPSSRKDVACSELMGELGSGRMCPWGKDGRLPPTWGRGAGHAVLWATQSVGIPLVVLLEEKKECCLCPLPNLTGVPSPPPAQLQTYLPFFLFCIQHQSSPVYSTSKTPKPSRFSPPHLHSSPAASAWSPDASSPHLVQRVLSTATRWTSS